MRIVYVSDDGIKFDDEFECQDYEWRMQHPYLKDVQFLDENGDLLEDVFSEETYGKTEKIIVLTQEAVNDLIALGEYTGFCCYRDVTHPGIWKFNPDIGVETFEEVK